MEKNFENFVQSIMKARELCNEIRIFTWDFEFRPNESVSATPQDRDKAKSFNGNCNCKDSKASVFT
jgi:hypothetical protein